MPLTTQISSKGQIVIPAELREELNLQPGTRLTVQRDGMSIVLHPVTPEFIRSLRGCTQGAGDLREQLHRDDEDR
jgi:AbrB family looped-hinge helix DNA binding protein